MNKTILSSLLTMSFSVAGFSQTILRTAKLELNGSRYTVEVQMNTKQLGAGVSSKVSLEEYGDADIPGHGFYRCEETLTIQGDVEMTYTLKNAAGQPVGRQILTPEMTSTMSIDAEKDSVCSTHFASRVEADFSSVGQFVSFKTAQGILSVSVNFNAYVASDESYVALVDANSLTEVRTFLNNTNGRNIPLIDPANPPVIEEVSPYCNAHPYDCD